MAERKPAKTGTEFKGLTDDERAALKDRTQELKAEARRGRRADKADEESAVLAKIAEMPEPDRVMGERLHEIIKASAPALSPKLFSDEASLYESGMWPTSFAVKELTAADEARIAAPVKKAVS